MSTQPSACEQLAQSRERLRQVLGRGSRGRATDDAVGVSGAANIPGWLAGLTNAPEASLLFDLLQSWWCKQPIHGILALAAQAATALLLPTAQRHPYRLVLGAALAGGVVVLVRPWRWITSTALLATLLPKVMSEVSKHWPAQPPNTASPGHDLAP